MVKFIIVFAGLFLSIHLKAQTGIGTTTPHASAKLDVSASNKGFLPPRVTLTSNTDATTIPSPAEGLLVYNLGSVGLQAGYYYWNNANWATIATATSAGNGVTASDMVKIYDGVGNAATINANGTTFSVTTSGKYLFDFSTSATCSNCTVTINFQVRDGSNSNTVIGSDYQTSYNNNVHAEYNGKVEVNLIAGRSYNVLVTASSGGIYNNDYTRVYMKQVSGNLPVTGQSVDYVSVVRTTSQTVNTGDNLIFNTNNGGNIPYNSSTGIFSLSAGKTYRLTGSVSMDGSTAINSAMDIAWKTAAGEILGNRGLTISTNYNSTAVGNGLTDIVYTPTINTTVALNVISSSANAKTVANYTYANITQIGSSAIINPWTLSGTNTYNTTGNVGIGNSAPTTTLDVSGSLGVSGSGTFRTIGGDEGGEIEFGVPQTNTTLSTRVVTDVWQNRYRIFDGNTKGVYIDLSKAPTGVGGELLIKASGLVNRGVDVTLGNLKARMAASGNASLQLSTVSGTYSIYGSGIYSQAGTVVGATIDGGSPRTISTTPSYLVGSYSFGTAGSTDTWVLMDTSNSIAWRITMILGAGVNNNLITIERLF